MPIENQKLERFNELLIELTEPSRFEKEILKLYLKQYGIGLFDHLDLVYLPPDLLVKLDTIRILIAIAAGKEGNE